MAAAHRGILLATAAMIARNGTILLLLAPRALMSALFSFALMLGASVGWALLRFEEAAAAPAPQAESSMASGTLALPFSLWSALKFGFIFLVLHVIGVVAQQFFGKVGFYIVSVIGGAVSSASAVAAAASLAASKSILPQVAATGAVLASIASVGINLPFVLRAKNRSLSLRLSIAMIIIAALGGLGMVLSGEFAHWIEKYFFELS